MSVEQYLRKKIRSKGAIHLSLIDPEKVGRGKSGEMARMVEEAGSDAILIGGSTGVMQRDVDRVIEEVKAVSSLPVIIFPGGVTNISSKADAILFMSLLNSSNPFYIIGAQMLGAPIVKKYGLEAIPTAYIIVGYGGTAGYVGEARPVPYDKPEISVAYALAGELLGMRVIYLEAGSGAPRPVPETHIAAVKKNVEKALVMVGGGIRRRETALRAVAAGADIVVTGTVIEEEGGERLREVIRGIEEGVKNRL